MLHVCICVVGDVFCHFIQIKATLYIQIVCHVILLYLIFQFKSCIYIYILLYNYKYIYVYIYIHTSYLYMWVY